MRTRLISSAVGLCVLFAVVLLRNTLVLPVVLGVIIAIILYELAKAVGGEQHKLALCTVMTYGFLSPVTQYLLMRAPDETVMLVSGAVKDLLLHDDDMVIEELMDRNVVFATTTEDQESVSEKFSDYDLMAMPVVDKEGRLVGIVTVDDVIDVMEQEATEDMEIMAAITPSDKSP